MERNIEIVKISIEVVEYSIEFLKKNMAHGEECKDRREKNSSFKKRVEVVEENMVH